MPGACAPSMSTGTSGSNAATIASTGKTRAVGEVTWSTITSRVLAPTAVMICSTTSFGEVGGNGIGTSTTSAPVRACPGVGGVAAGLVLVVGDDDLVAGTERQGRKHDVDSGGGVGDEHRVRLLASDELAQPTARLDQRRVVLLLEEPHGVRFHPPPPVVLVFEDADGGGTVGAVVEMCHVRVEEPHVSRFETGGCCQNQDPLLGSRAR